MFTDTNVTLLETNSERLYIQVAFSLLSCASEAFDRIPENLLFEYSTTEYQCTPVYCTQVQVRSTHVK